MKVMLTGGKGMLGRTLAKELRGFEVVPTDLPDCDICDLAAITARVCEIKPDAVVHCAAMTQVDLCESNMEKAFRINGKGTANVAYACKKAGARLIAISTDYVFPGDGTGAYSESAIATGGATVYGRSKFAGENAAREILPTCVIARIAWLYGAGGPSFVHTMLSLADKGLKEIKVVDDQRGNPTSTLAVARALCGILGDRRLEGIFHLTCEGEATWCDFAREIFRLAKRDVRVLPCTTAEFPRPAPRPANSCLAKDSLRKANLPQMPHWKDALAEFFAAGI
ncbi:MAG: dTDP-4-dehydrorhamnose reductase [Kiritimatiellae bacterium]|nr:dTDP-4-dehydrorhamnose reductase [Kiritimatiellia bacterium]